MQCSAVLPGSSLCLLAPRHVHINTTLAIAADAAVAHLLLLMLPCRHFSNLFDQALTWEFVSWLKSVSPLPVLLKASYRGSCCH